MTQELTYKIAIDGPAGAGKTTIAKEIARVLDYRYIDTGAMYRAFALKALRNNIIPNDKTAVTEMLANTDLDIKYDCGRQIVLLDGEDVSDDIRTIQVASAASDIGTVGAVRQRLLELQRDLAMKHNVIMDGRDIGTFVLPHADIKIFLTATTDDRAKRRFEELQAKGSSTTFEQVKKDLKYRDKNDSTRAIAPLMVAPDAIIVDTSDNTLEQSITVLQEIIQEKLHEIAQNNKSDN